MIQIANPSSGRRYTEVLREIAQRFPVGRFVAVESGQVVADAETHRKLVADLQGLGKSPKDMLIVQAGVEYPESAVIFAGALGQPTHV